MPASWTESEMVPSPERASASATIKARLLGPGAVAASTTAENEKMLSPPVASPLLPSSKNIWIAEPPISLRSPVTVRPVLAGFAPGVTVAVSSVVSPGDTTSGLAAPSTDGGVGPVGEPVTWMSSMPIHSSLLTAFVVMMRTWTTGWLSAAAGSAAATGVTRVARLGPLEASATKPAGTFVKSPVLPTRNCRATAWTALSIDPSMSRRL